MSESTGLLSYNCPGCGAPIDVDLIIEGEPQQGEEREFAVTCDSCHRSAWFTLKATLS